MKYKVTGSYYNSKRNFPAIHTDSLAHAMSINLWNGNVWEKIGGSYKRIKTVFN